MYTEKDKYEVLKKVLESKTFAKSTTLSVLLKLLLTRSGEGKVLSALEIGLELFGSKCEHEKAEINARVNVSHLRKKLNKYYESEGKHDKVRLSIDRGSYELSFESNIKKSTRNRALIISCIVLVMTVPVILLLKKQAHEPVWSNTFNNGYSNILYISESFGYRGKTITGKIGWIRDYSLNSAEDFHNAYKSAPEEYQNTRPANYSYITFLKASVIQKISRFFMENNTDFTIYKASDFHLEDYNSQNLMYMGSYKTSKIFCSFFNEKSENIKILQREKYILRYIDSNKKKIFIPLESDDLDGEHVIVARFVDANKSTQHMFISNHDLGLKATTDYFTNSDSLKIFSEKYLQESGEFVALFYVKGKDRTNFNMKLLYVDRK